MKGVMVMTDNNQPKPDDRSDNVERLQEMVQDTIQNIEKAHETMEFTSGEEKEAIKAKNKRREQAIEGMRAEIKDEYRNQEDQ
jgi:small acid-soluble spore protein (thioredoxin-like protein)